MPGSKGSKEPVILPIPRGAARDACSHYRTGCSVVAPCCGRVYPCRRCHDEVEDHRLPRESIQQLVCRSCATFQGVRSDCRRCGATFGEAWSCEACRVFEDEDRGQFHCADCGVCRVGGASLFRHCRRCGCCIERERFDDHVCVEGFLEGGCPVCLEELTDSREGVCKLHCGHAIHTRCLEIMARSGGRARCPICSCSILPVDPASAESVAIRRAVAETPMPAELRGLRVGIMCNDCHSRSEAAFHVVGMECPECHSWNTRRL